MSAGADDQLARVLVAASPNGIMLTDSEGRIRSVNPAMAEMVPLVPDPVGRLPLEASPIQPLADALDPATPGDVEFAVHVGTRDLLIKVVPLEELGGRMALVQDVTKLRRAERYRSEFVGNVSHELRTPATSIAGYAETLLEDRDTLDPYVVDMVEVIHRNAKRLTDLFDDLLHLTRLEAREGPLDVGPIPLAPVVAEAMDKCSVLALEKQIHFEVVVDRALHVRGNREAMAHVVQNLVSNAVKYSHEGGVVTVRALPRGEQVRFEVIDVGIGIDPSHHERVFERFYRVDKGRARTAGGTGLGLAIVKRLVHMMHAEIELRSRPGRGSVFRVTLELAEALS